MASSSSRGREGGEQNENKNENDYAAACASPWRSRDVGDPKVLSVTVELLRSYERENTAGVVRSMAMAIGKEGGLLYTSASSDGPYIRSWNRGIPAEGGFSAEYGPNNALLVSNTATGGFRIHVASSDGRVRVWEVGPAGQPPPVNRLHDLPWLDDGMREDVWRKKMEVLRWLRSRSWESYAVTRMSFSEVVGCENNNIPAFLYTGSTDCSIKVWSLRDSTLVDVVKKHTNGVLSVAAGCGGRVFSGSQDGFLYMWLRAEKQKEKGKGGSRSATGNCINGVSHSVLETLLCARVSVNALLLKSRTTGFATEAGRSELYAGLSNGRVVVWKEGKDFARSEMETLRGHEGRAVTCLAGSPAGHLVFSGSQDGRICGWSSKNGTREEHTRMIVLNQAHVGRVHCIAAQDQDWEEKISNEEEATCILLYSGGQDNTLKTWRIRYRIGGGGARGGANNIHVLPAPAPAPLPVEISCDVN